VPGIIFRSSVVEPQVKYAYYQLHTHYAQLFVWLRSFDMSTQVYTTRHPIVIRGSAPTGIGSEIWVYWLRSLAALPTARSRQVALRYQFLERGVFSYGKAILWDIRYQRTIPHLWSIWKQVFELAPGLANKLIVLLNLPLILVPLRAIRLAYPLIMNKPCVERNLEQMWQERA
jgi:hypothetical protein